MDIIHGFKSCQKQSNKIDHFSPSQLNTGSAFFVKEKVRELTEGFILWPEKLFE